MRVINLALVGASESPAAKQTIEELEGEAAETRWREMAARGLRVRAIHTSDFVRRGAINVYTAMRDGEGLDLSTLEEFHFRTVERGRMVVLGAKPKASP